MNNYRGDVMEEIPFGKLDVGQNSHIYQEEEEEEVVVGAGVGRR